LINYIQIDNFFEDVDKVRHRALSCEYEQSSNITGWKGFRTKIIDSQIIDYIKSKIIQIDNDFKNLDLDIFFHYSTEKTKSEVENFDEYRLHKDLTEWAGVIYLSPNPNPNSGTTLHSDNGKIIHNIENKYNRFIFYKGEILHGVLDTFGDNIETSRMTITIFGNNKKRNGLI
jgi:hypothetical protein